MSIDTERSHTPKLTVIGGGTGSSTLLRELKRFTPNIRAIPAMADSGGSTGILRDELGILPQGDLVQCFSALTRDPDWERLLRHRIDEGSLNPHTVGNVIMGGLERDHGKVKAIRKANRMFNIIGEVIPVSYDDHHLVMIDGVEEIRGEGEIDHYHIKNENPRIFLDPPARINPDAEEAILDTDILVVAPGSVYGSLLAPLAVNGVKEAIERSAAKKVMVTNLVTTPGHTNGWHVVDYVKALETLAGEGIFHYVLYNNQLPPKDLLTKYASQGEFPVDFSQERFSEIRAQAIADNFVATVSGKSHEPALVRHNARKVGSHLMRIFYTN